MPDISTITVPTGNTYNIKDATAREMIAALQNTENVLSTNAATTPYGVTWDDDGTTITGTLVASSETVKKIYLVPNDSNESGNIYSEYLTLKVGNTYTWEKIGSTKVDVSGLGDLAYKDSATTSYTPSGTVTAPTVTLNTTNIQVIDSVGALPSCTFPSMGANVSNENLILSWSEGTFNAGSVPTKKTAIAVATSVQNVSAPSFSGDLATITVT